VRCFADLDRRYSKPSLNVLSLSTTHGLICDVSPLLAVAVAARVPIAPAPVGKENPTRRG
jgi:hypothetical protein